jgi:hypothetical protein
MSKFALNGLSDGLCHEKRAIILQRHFPWVVYLAINRAFRKAPPCGKRKPQHKQARRRLSASALPQKPNHRGGEPTDALPTARVAVAELPNGLVPIRRRCRPSDDSP